MRYQSTIILTLTALSVLLSCKKQKNNNGGDAAKPVVDAETGTGFSATPTDPATASSVGFFLNDWQPKSFTVGNTVALTKPVAAATTIVTVDLSQVIAKVSRYMFGNNANPYMGQMTGDATLIGHITNLAPRIIRAPGGSLSDLYFWNANDGQAPADVPGKLYNDQGALLSAGYWYGKNAGSWTCSLDNYYAMLVQTSSTSILTVNYGYARYGTGEHPVQTAAHLAADWVRYDKGRTRYWEVGNENFGIWEAGYHIDVSKNRDGQPEYLTGNMYGQHFKIFADSMRKAAADIGVTIKIGAVLTEAESAGNPSIISNWNKQVLAQAGNSPDFYAVHSYYTPYNTNASPEIILPTAITESKAIADYVKASAQTAGVTPKPIALTEWNINSVGSRQMVSNIAGLHAAMVLGEIIKNQFGMASRWDLANAWDSGNDHGLFNNPFTTNNTEPNATAWNPRPAFYYLYYFQKYFGDRMVPATVQGSADILSYGSSFSSGQAGVVLVNKSARSQVVGIKVNNFDMGANYYYHTLNGGTDNGNFSAKVLVNDQGPAGNSGGPANYAAIAPNQSPVSGGIRVNVPAYGAVFLVVAKK